MKIRGSHLVALAIAAGLVGWMYTGEIIIGGQADANQPTIAEREAKRSAEAFRVRTVTLQPTERAASIMLRGRTKANTRVSVRAETGGVVEQRLVNEGDVVKPGDLLCSIDRGVRETQLAQAKASLEQAEADFQATKALLDRGFATQSKLRSLRTALDAAKAAVASAELELKRTEVRAEVGGIVQKPYAEVGDVLSNGGVCVTLMDTDPMLFTGQVSERDVGKLTKGMKGQVRLITGDVVTGTIRSIAVAADEKTRTFEVELSMPNPYGTLRDGLTAETLITLKPTLAYQVQANWLTLADNGAIGVRVVDADNTVRFKPVTILSHGDKSMWVSGLEPGLEVIVLGQNFVAAGEKVEPVPVRPGDLAMMGVDQ